MGMLVITTLAQAGSGCSMQQCICTHCRTYERVVVRVISKDGPLPASCTIIVRGTLWNPLDNPAIPQISKEGLPIGRDKDDIGQYAEWTCSDKQSEYEAQFQVNNRDEKIYLYGFIDLNNNGRIDSGEPYGILAGQPIRLRPCVTLDLHIRIDMSQKYSGVSRW
jgi:hypothetical protein